MKECRLHKVYDRMMETVEIRFLQTQRKEMFRNIRGHVLEIGGGTGANFPFLSCDDSSPVISEPSWIMCRQLKKKIPFEKLQLVACPAERLPFPNQRFDCAVSTLVLCSVVHPLVTLQEIHRVLRPGGRMIFLEHTHAQGFRSVLQTVIQPLWTAIGCGCHPNRKIPEMISAAGFEIQGLELLDPSREMPLLTRIAMQVTLPFARGFARKKKVE